MSRRGKYREVVWIVLGIVALLAAILLGGAFALGAWIF